MTTVRLSNRITTDVLRQAHSVMSPAVTRLQEQAVDPTWGPRIYDALFADHTAIIAQLPTWWVKSETQFRIAKVCGVPCNLTCILPTPRPWPHQFGAVEMGSAHGYWSTSICINAHEAWKGLDAEIAAVQARITAADTRRTVFVESVRRLMASYTTLAPALAAWPPLWGLLSEAVQVRHNEGGPRTTKWRGPPADVDIAQLTAMLAAAKLGG